MRPRIRGGHGLEVPTPPEVVRRGQVESPAGYALRRCIKSHLKNQLPAPARRLRIQFFKLFNFCFILGDSFDIGQYVFGAPLPHVRRNPHRIIRRQAGDVLLF